MIRLVAVCDYGAHRRSGRRPYSIVESAHVVVGQPGGQGSCPPEPIANLRDPTNNKVKRRENDPPVLNTHQCRSEPDQGAKCSTACDQTERATRKHEERVAMCACRFGRINARRTN